MLLLIHARLTYTNIQNYFSTFTCRYISLTTLLSMPHELILRHKSTQSINNASLKKINIILHF